jgi:metal-responsive CopG/Arc/MetJ family transcriptional regulator
MASVKVTVTVDSDTLKRVDSLVARNVYPNRSQAFQAALAEKLARLDRTRLVTECAKLEPSAEQALADEGLDRERDAWPEY